MEASVNIQDFSYLRPVKTETMIPNRTCRQIRPAHRTVSGYRAVIPTGHVVRGLPLSYQALAPDGAGRPCAVPTTPPPFLHTHSHPRPQPATTVWRNLQQHPQCADATTTLHSPFSILNSSFSHTFSAKERDTETGLSYFGSRYYSSDLSIWLSVDPMSDKYPSLSTYVYCANNPIKLVDPNGMEAAKPPLHHQFLITVGMQVYKAAKKNGASSNGAILVLAQASLESGWGKSAMRYNDYNLFGVMGTPSKRSTTHGPVKDYSNLGGYEAAINDYFKKAKSRWPKWTDVLSQNDFTSEDIDKALNTGSYYPSKEDRQNGKYAYCGDLDENGESHYGESLIKQFSSTKKRFKDSLIYQIMRTKKLFNKAFLILTNI